MNMTINTNKKYKTLGQLGCGGQGIVFAAIHVSTGQKIAIKKANEKHAALLEHEYKIGKELQGIIGIPNIFSYEKFVSIETRVPYSIMTMELLGPSLHSRFISCNNNFSLKTVLHLGYQLIEIIEFIHSKRILHMDLKPENIATGLGEKNNQVYILDFGLATYYKNSADEHIAFEARTRPVGNLHYSSNRSVFRCNKSRRDDLESIMNILIFFHRGMLPWNKVTATNPQDKIKHSIWKKQTTSIAELCADCSPEFIEFIVYCRDLKFAEEPCYNYLKNLIKKVICRNNFSLKCDFEWNKPNLEIV